MDGRRRIPRLVALLPLVAPALVALVAGLWTGLVRLGIDVDPLRPELASLHGPLLVWGFLGTQIGLERAVALRRRWPYLVPAATAAGAADTRAMIAVPVYVKGELAGVVSAINPADGGLFSAEDMEQLSFRAYLIGLVLADTHGL